MIDHPPNVPVPTATESGARSGTDSWGDQRWDGMPPDPLSGGELYQGVMGRRIFAYMADVVILTMLLLGAWMVAVTAGIATMGLLWPILLAVITCIPFLYHTLLIGGIRSATWGMCLFDIEVRDLEGDRPNLLQAVAMTLVFYISVSITAWLVLVIAPFNTYHRTLHDFATRLVVVRSTPRHAAPSELMP